MGCNVRPSVNISAFLPLLPYYWQDYFDTDHQSHSDPFFNEQFDGFSIKIYVENIMSVVEHSVDIQWAMSGVFTWNSFTKDSR